MKWILISLWLVAGLAGEVKAETWRYYDSEGNSISEAEYNRQLNRYNDYYNGSSRGSAGVTYYYRSTWTYSSGGSSYYTRNNYGTSYGTENNYGTSYRTINNYGDSYLTINNYGNGRTTVNDYGNSRTTVNRRRR